MSAWNIYHRSHGQCWAHESLPIWIVEYPATNVRGRHFQAYIASGKLIRGKHPCAGGVDNKRIGSENGFMTSDEAMEAAEEKATDNKWAHSKQNEQGEYIRLQP